jgi:hypothetical protein
MRTSVRDESRTVLLITLAACVLAPAVVDAQETQPQSAQTCYQDEQGRIVNRRRPGTVEVPCPAPTSTPSTPGEPGATPQPEGAQPARPDQPFRRGPPPSASPIPRPGVADYPASVPIPDRWRIVDTLGYRNSLFDPYNRNVLKADRPVHDDWFFNVSVLSDSVYESRDLVSGVGNSTANPGTNDIFGRTSQYVLSQTIATEFVYYKGDTVFKPPDYEWRFTPVFNYNYVSLDENGGVNIDPRRGLTRRDQHVGIQAAFFDKELRRVSERFDFDSIRIGIQPFTSDFRGFLFQDNQLGLRFFGTRANNIFQYNLAWFRRIEKDTNSGLNDLNQPLRKDDVVAANLYWQDLPVRGFTSQATVVYNRNREGDETYYNKNGFLERPAALGLQMPREYDVTYIGYNGDGHFGRTNITTSLYYAIGKSRPGTFITRDQRISAGFAALEVSRDFDWIRGRVSLLWGSGDDDPYDDRATGFDAIFENPQFAGGETSYWIRQAVPLVGGGGVALATRNGVLNSLRSSKDEGQSNFENPGILLAGIGVDLDLLPTLRLSFNVNSLYFADTSIVSAARNEPATSAHIGEDVSAALIYRPLMSQNIVLRASYARLLSGKSAESLFPQQDPSSLLLNVLLAF